MNRRGARRRRGGQLLALVLGLIAPMLTVTSGPASAAIVRESAAAAPPGVSIDGLAPGHHLITLVTGDRLRLDGAPGGQFAVTVDAFAPRPPGQPATSVTVVSTGDTITAIPDDLTQAVASGQLDRRLFDVKYLAEHGMTDAANPQLPLIVQYGSAGGFATAQALPASDATRALDSIGATAVSVPKATVREFWAGVRAGTGAGPSVLSGGIQRIWLDGTAELALDVSVPLIGAPQAWQSGLDGAGSTVAVLDSGADLNHPDLAGQITAAESFIPGMTAADDHGHGTHVATIIAGTGAASGGKYKGVAPGAKLLVGKVCYRAANGDGVCPDSAIIDGMEWAAASGADVVSLSLGGTPTDGTDPLSAAVNSLTESSGALFVVAAGNAGPAAGSVGTPASADAALAVAATTKSDGLAAFSSRGPRTDGALKPEIAAPGVNIVAGRAAGTTMGRPVDDFYTAADGTSMATPHVSGAAAILAQRFPDWRAGALKAGLMSTSKDVGFSVYETGAGRVDVARAASQQVFATTSTVDFGNLDPGQSPDPVGKEVTYTNLGDTPVTLTMARTLRQLGGDPVPAATFTGEDTVTVPAKATATTTVTLDVPALPEGRFSGSVTATDAASGVAVTTPVGLERQPPKIELRVQLLGPDGKPACAQGCSWINLMAVDAPDTTVPMPEEIGPGLWRVWVLPGTYGVVGEERWTDPVTGVDSKAYLPNPEFAVTESTTVTLDARAAKEVTMRTPRASVPYAQGISYARLARDGTLVMDAQVSGSVTWTQNRLLLGSTKKVTTGKFQFGVNRAYTNPQVSMTVQGRNGFALNLLHRGYADQGRVMVGPDWVPWPARHGTVELVDVGYARPEDLAGKQLKGKLALMRWGDDRYGAGGTGPDGNPDSFMWTDRVRALEDAGAIGYLAMSSPPPGWAGSPSFGTPTNFVSRPFGDGPSTITLPEVQIPRDQGEKLLRLTAKGTVRISLHADPNIRYTYRLYPQYEQQIPASQQQVYSARNLAEVDNEYHGTTPYQMDNRVTAYASGWPAIGTSILKAVGPTRRTDYYGPVSSRVTVQTSSQTSADGRNWTSIGAYDRPGEYQARWFLPATASGPYNLGAAGYAAQASSKSFINLLCDLCREGDLLWPWIAHPTGDGTVSLDMSAVPQLFGGDGAEIPLSSIPEADGLPAFRLPSGAADYHLVVDRPGEHTSWTFRSATPTRDTSVPGVECTGRVAADFGHCAVQPLIYLGYGFGSSVRLDNTVVAGRRHEFTVFARHDAAGAALPRIAGVRVWTSTDDGVTWQPATVRQGRHGYSVTAKYPPLSATTGAVSIKAEAWDVDGNRVDQVLTRAFPLAAR